MFLKKHKSEQTSTKQKPAEIKTIFGTQVRNPWLVLSTRKSQLLMFLTVS